MPPSLLRLLLLFIGLALYAPATLAQPTQDAPSSDEAAADVSQAQIADLLATLEDDAARERFLENLRTLASLEAEEAAAAEATGAGLAANALELIDGPFAWLGSRLADLGAAFAAIPRAAESLYRALADPERLMAIGQSGLAALVIVALGVIARLLLQIALARPRERLEQRALGQGVSQKIGLLALRILMDFLPLAAFLLVAYLSIGLIATARLTELAAATIINAALTSGAIIIIAKAILSPWQPALRPTPLNDDESVWLYRWIRRIVQTAIWGNAAAVIIGFLAGRSAREAGQILVGLAVTALLVTLVLRSREAVAERIKGVRGRTGFFATIRRWLAEVWHIIALAYIGFGFFVWTLNISGGFTYLLRATALTAVILVAARLGVLLFDYVVRLETRRYDLAVANAEGEAPTAPRAHAYLPLARRVVIAIIGLIAAVAILEAWDVAIIGWLATEAGRSVFGSLVSIGLVLLGAFVVWEVASAAVERRLSAPGPDGGPPILSARAKTLLPLLRNTIMIALIVITGLIVLSELGVDIAPLLAGAGVLGLAIGFGAQTLVKDIITGLFILLENQIQVGEVVDVGDHDGVVEGMTIRTLRLRDLSGSIHIVPYGSITTVQNLTRDFSYYLLDIRVSYREDTDRIVEIVKELVAELRDDPAYGPVITSDAEILGVNSFEDSWLILRARIKTLPIQQWYVGREFNRRMKKRFDELGIEIPTPRQRLYFGEDKEGRAAPARIRLEADEDVTGQREAGRA